MIKFHVETGWAVLEPVYTDSVRLSPAPDPMKPLSVSIYSMLEFKRYCWLEITKRCGWANQYSYIPKIYVEKLVIKSGPGVGVFGEYVMIIKLLLAGKYL